MKRSDKNIYLEAPGRKRGERDTHTRVLLEIDRGVFQERDSTSMSGMLHVAITL